MSSVSAPGDSLRATEGCGTPGGRQGLQREGALQTVVWVFPGRCQSQGRRWGREERAGQAGNQLPTIRCAEPPSAQSASPKLHPLTWPRRAAEMRPPSQQVARPWLFSPEVNRSSKGLAPSAPGLAWVVPNAKQQRPRGLRTGSTSSRPGQSRGRRRILRGRWRPQVGAVRGHEAAARPPTLHLDFSGNGPAPSAGQAGETAWLRGCGGHRPGRGRFRGTGAVGHPGFAGRKLGDARVPRWLPDPKWRSPVISSALVERIRATRRDGRAEAT